MTMTQVNPRRHLNMRRTWLTLTLAATAAALTAAPAGAGQWMCIPDTAGAAVTSGGASGSCTNATPVKLPASAADQQKLIDILPFMTFQAQGIGAKPTIVFKGANLQIRRGSDYVTKDGTGNLIVGSGVNYTVASTHTGSENLAVGYDSEWSGNGNAMVGSFHKASGYSSLLAGRQSTSTGSANFVSGLGNSASGQGGGMLGGYFNTLAGEESALAGGKQRNLKTDYGVLADGSGDDVHWARYDSTGKLVASSEPMAYTYSGYNYSLSSWSGVNLTKCTLSTQVEGVDGQLTTSVASPYYDQYAYVRFYKPASATSTNGMAASGVPHTVTANCNRQPGATG
jgi:hypothetical protein